MSWSDKLSKPYRVRDGKHFRLKDYDPADMRGEELNKEEGIALLNKSIERMSAAIETLRPGPLGVIANFPGNGCRGKRWCNQPCHVRRESSGMPGLFLQAAIVGRVGPRLPLAHYALPTGAWTHRNIQPVLLRRGVGSKSSSQHSR